MDSVQKIILNKNPFETSAGSQTILKKLRKFLSPCVTLTHGSSEDFPIYAGYKPNVPEKAKLL